MQNITLNKLPASAVLIQVLPDVVMDIYDKLQRYDRLFPEDSTMFNSVEDLAKRLVDGKTVGFEVPQGLILLNEIAPGVSGKLHITFYDGKISERVELVKQCVSWFFLELNLHRISVDVPEFAKAYRRFIEKKLLFKCEGRLREVLQYKEGFCDLFIYSCLRGEGV